MVALVARPVSVPHVVGFQGGGWHRAGHRGNLGEFFQEVKSRPTLARANDALSVKDVLATSGGMQGLKDVLSTLVRDALHVNGR